ncbi:MAG: prolipoprotein diacylglyceryl transferase [Clostridia bacterium]|nr:prolipoprotein diacylglyceryl transferase [Clostridia bacterium]
MDQITVSFPGLGIEEFHLNKIAFTLFGRFEVRWYGLIITLGIILAVLYCAYRSSEVGITKDDLLDMALYTVIFGVLGARLYYVLMTIGVYEYKSIIDVIAIWEGGLAIYGGVIGGCLAIYVFCRIKKISWLRAFDMAAPAVMIGQFMGRWGNFFNGEAYGYEVPEESFLYFMRMGLIPNINSSLKMDYFHPTFLYESLWNFIGFLLINALFRKRKFDGQVALMYFTWYGFGRMWIEGLRTDSLYLGVFRVSQVVGFICFALGGILLTVGLVFARRRAAAGEAYESCYAKCTGKLSVVNSAKAEDAPKVSEGAKDDTNEQEDTKNGTEN